MDLSNASRDELLATLIQRDVEIGELRRVVSDQHTRIDKLAERVEQLQARLGKDSTNSSKPPSSDPPYTKKAKRGMRRSSGRKPGKQPGAPGAALRQVEDPDEVVLCELANCPNCGASLADAPVLGIARRQVFDPPPPPPRPHVTEYQIVTRRCGCGARVAGPAPAGVAAPASYGPRTAALAVYLGSGRYLPVKRCAGVLATLTSMAPSTGWLVAQRTRAAALIEAQFLPRVRSLLRSVGLLHVDETPGRAAGKLSYVHVACTQFLTAMHVGNRSAATIDGGGVLPGYDGVLVRDGYAGYLHLLEAQHAWRGAHSLRDLHGVYDADPDGQLWAKAMADTLLEANTAANVARAAGQSAIEPARLATIVNHYRGAAGKGVADNDGATGASLARDALTLARRFRDHEEMILRFVTDLAVPLTNDQCSHCTSWMRSALPRWCSASAGVCRVILAGACDSFRFSAGVSSAVRFWCWSSAVSHC